MAEKTKEEIAEELRAEYRAAIKRTAEEEDTLRRQGTFRPGGKKSMGIAYLFWFLLGGFGLHRFYLGRPLSGAAMLALMIAGVVLSFQPLLVIFSIVPGAALFVWWLLDAFLIPKMVP
jgi:TM2 domain-containing membrane protein YozV